MKILLDTSVLVAAMVETHPSHAIALSWLHKVKNKTVIGLVSAHSIAELYSILTTYPIRPRISPASAQKMLRENVLELFEPVPLSAEDYEAVINHLSDMGIIGGVTYDALILYAALKANADQIVTLNEKDFRRVFPKLAVKIISP